MSDERNIYLLNPNELSPETIAVAFAKTSRSPKSFKEIAQELSEEKASNFHEKWVIGYGHASVAEHAVLHIAIENISRLAIETLESNRLASYTEKSTRYQKWDPDFFYFPQELTGSQYSDLYTSTCRMLFDTYQQALPDVKAVVEKEYPQNPNESLSNWDRRIRTEYVDVCRFLLPAASMANVGITINARSLEHAIRKLLSHPLKECQQIGTEIKAVTQQETPTLVKYANSVPYLEKTRSLLTHFNNQHQEHQKNDLDWCNLIAYNNEGENQILAAALYRFGDCSFENYLQLLNDLPEGERRELAVKLLGDLAPHDIPLRELEHANFTFDLTLDQGAYFELKRHRMMTQTAQMLTPKLGYTLPRKIEQANLTEIYHRAMTQVENTFDKIYQYNPNIASYIVPNGYKRRVLLTFNLRSAFHFVNLRAAPNAHFSIRRIALRIAEIIARVSPLLAPFMNLPTNETWQQIEEEYFSVF